MTPHLEACLSGGGRIGQVGIGRNNLLKPVRRASCERILCNYPGVWRARNCDGRCGGRPFKKRTADIAAAFEKTGQARGSNPAMSVGENGPVFWCALFAMRTFSSNQVFKAPNCCITEKRLATPQWSVILPLRTRMTST